MIRSRMLSARSSPVLTPLRGGLSVWTQRQGDGRIHVRSDAISHPGSWRSLTTSGSSSICSLDKNGRPGLIRVESANLATSAEPTAKATVNNDEWLRFYQFPHIVAVNRLLRAKVHVASATVLGMPFAVAAYTNSFISADDLQGIMLLGFIPVSALAIAGSFGRRLLGAAYENKARDKVRLAHLTFWGRRSELIVDSHDISQLSDFGESMDSQVVEVRRYSRPKPSFYILPKFGGIENVDAFQRVFGELPTKASPDVKR